MTYLDREQRLAEFVEWCAKHITGDEKGEAQTFIERLFIAFGQKGARDVGGTFEERIRQLFDDGKKTSFADYVWKPVVLIEMKKRGADLSKHRQQAFDYWTHIAPGRPKYVVLSNFDEFWVYDFNTQLYSPKDKIRITDLPQRWEPLAFLFPTNEAPRFGNDREKVTREAADKLATCFRKLIHRKVDRDLAQRFVLQSMISMFAEDIGLLPKSFFTKLVEECKQPSDSYDLLGGLFEAMNTPPPKADGQAIGSLDSGIAGGRYKGVRYFNGGIFTQPARIELYEDELNQIRGNPGVLFGAAQSDWSKVEPEIFGAIFQESMESGERHAFGAHFTSAEDIMKIVKPTISDPFGEAIAKATTSKRLNELLEILGTLRILDPACGSGNFLYLAYREMKRLETRIRERLTAEFPEFQPTFAHVNARQFFGMDINPFAVELAKVTLMIARKLAIDELHIVGEIDLPLENLDANFRGDDALMTTEDMMGKKVCLKTPWPPADIIIGNPPFLGAKLLKPERGPAYINALRKLYPEVPGMADYCVYWFRRTHDHLPPNTKENSFAGRAGLVGTQNIRNNKSRVGGLDHVVTTGTIVEAVDNQPWSGEANVHVSIANWIKTRDATLLPHEMKLWSPVDEKLKKQPKERAKGPAHKTYELEIKKGPIINSALSLGIDVSMKKYLDVNKRPKRCFQGKIPGYEGFMLDANGVRRLGGLSAVVVPYLTGRELLSDFHIDRWAIDFGKRDMVTASSFIKAFAHVECEVLPAVRQSVDRATAEKSDMEDARKEHLNRWWQFWNRRDELSDVLRRLSRYAACSRVTRRPVIVFLSPEICPSDLVQVFAFEDDYAFGVLQSSSHFDWFGKSSRLKVESDLRYSVREVFDTFPWPQSPTTKQIESVASAAVEVRRVRSEALKVTTGGLRAVYRTLELPGKHPLKDAHAALDAAVLAAYGFDPKKDLLAQLLELNLSVAAAEKRAEKVTAPGIPPTYPNPQNLITTDCITPE